MKDLLCGEDKRKILEEIENIIDELRNEKYYKRKAEELQWKLETMKRNVKENYISNLTIEREIDEYEKKFKAEKKNTINYHLYRIIIDDVLNKLLKNKEE